MSNRTNLAALANGPTRLANARKPVDYSCRTTVNRDLLI